MRDATRLVDDAAEQFLTARFHDDQRRQPLRLPPCGDFALVIDATSCAQAASVSGAAVSYS